MNESQWNADTGFTSLDSRAPASKTSGPKRLHLHFSMDLPCMMNPQVQLAFELRGMATLPHIIKPDRGKCPIS